MNSGTYLFSFEVKKNDRVIREIVSELGMKIVKPKCSSYEAFTSQQPLSFEVEETELAKIASEYISLAEIILPKDQIGASGIAFWFTFPTIQDLRGLHLPANFLSAIAPWKPSIDIAMQLSAIEKFE